MVPRNEGCQENPVITRYPRYPVASFLECKGEYSESFQLEDGKEREERTRSFNQILTKSADFCPGVGVIYAVMESENIFLLAYFLEHFVQKRFSHPGSTGCCWDTF